VPVEDVASQLGVDLLGSRRTAAGHRRIEALSPISRNIESVLTCP
jgi:hypothetical protein